MSKSRVMARWFLVAGVSALVGGFLAVIPLTYWVVADVYPWVPAEGYSFWRKIETVATWTIMASLVAATVGFSLAAAFSWARRVSRR